MDLTQLYGPGYAGYLQGRESAQGRNMQALQGMGMLSQMQRQQEQVGLMRQELALKKLAEERQRRQLEYGLGLLSGGGSNQAQAALTQGAQQGDIGPTVTNAERMGMLSPGGSQVGGLTPDQIMGLGITGIAKPKDILDIRAESRPKYDVQNGAIIGGAPGQVPQFQGFVPQAKMSDNGQASVLMPTPGGGMASYIPENALTNYELFRAADERAKGNNPIARANTNLDYANAADRGVNVPAPFAATTSPEQRAAPGAISRAELLRNEYADAKQRGDLNSMAELEREMKTLKISPQGGAQPTAPAISPAQERERSVNMPQATYAFRSTTANLDRLAAVATELVNDPGLRGIAGMQGVFPNIPGGPAANAEAKLSTLKNQVAISTLQAMRDASKTGGAVGNVTDREWPRLEGAIASLEKAQGYAQKQAALREIAKFAAESKAHVSEAYSMTYPQQREQIIPAEGMSAQPRAPNVVDFSSLGGARGR